MEAERIKGAGSRLWRAWVFGGMLWSVVFLLLATVVVGLLGAEQASSTFTIVMGAAVLAGGAYGIILIGALVVHVFKKVASGQPIMDDE